MWQKRKDNNWPRGEVDRCGESSRSSRWFSAELGGLRGVGWGWRRFGSIGAWKGGWREGSAKGFCFNQNCVDEVEGGGSPLALLPPK